MASPILPPKATPATKAPQRLLLSLLPNAYSPSNWETDECIELPCVNICFTLSPVNIAPGTWY